MDWLDLLAIQRTLKSLLQHHSSKASILQCSCFFIVQLSHPYTTTFKMAFYCLLPGASPEGRPQEGFPGPGEPVCGRMSLRMGEQAAGSPFRRLSSLQSTHFHSLLPFLPCRILRSGVGVARDQISKQARNFPSSRGPVFLRRQGTPLPLFPPLCPINY